MSSKDQRRQQTIFLIVVLAIVVIAIASGLHFSGIRFGPFGGGGGGGEGTGAERYSTMSDAQIICQERARSAFGQRIRTLVIDTHSSRLDKKAEVFRVFMEADLYANDKREGATARHFINCFVRTDRVAIASFQHAKDGDVMREPGKGLFGF